jgi:ADP-heptose:LPS heptosyltransferase
MIIPSTAVAACHALFGESAAHDLHSAPVGDRRYLSRRAADPHAAAGVAQCRITWIIGRVEAKLMSLMPEIEFLTVDKTALRRGVPAAAPRAVARRFDLMLQIHVSFRSSLLSTLVHAPVRLGFDRARARDFQWLFTNYRIEARRREHVLDSFWGFTDALGITERG